MILPWQMKEWELLLRLKKTHRLPHALLFSGMAGIGKAHFTHAFSRALFCTQPMSTGVCDRTCHDCQLLIANTHPSVLQVVPEKSGQAIKIDQIREVNEFVYQSTLQGDYCLVIINPAHHMNANAVNALLKTLEEPPSGVLIILISDQSARMPATILSRCQRISFHRPKQEEAFFWLKTELNNNQSNHMDPLLLLKLAQGAPLTALQFVQNKLFSVRQELFNITNPIQSAETLKEHEPLLLIDLLLSYLMDVLRLQLGAEVNSIVNHDYQKEIKQLKEQTVLDKNINFLNWLQKIRKQIIEGINLNKQLLIENMLIRFTLSTTNTNKN